MRHITLALLAASALGFSSSVMAADLIIDAPVVEAGVVDVGGNWDGAFVGVFGGYAWGELTDLPISTPEIDGWLLGVTAGVNFTLTDGIVAGIVGDIAWNNYEADDFEFTSGWNGSVRGRLGFDAGSFLPYLTAGVAFANGEYEPGDIENTHVGWTAGAGVEFAVTEDVSIDLQYRYTDYGTKDYTLFDTDVEAGATTHAVTAGLNWHF